MWLSTRAINCLTAVPFCTTVAGICRACSPYPRSCKLQPITPQNLLLFLGGLRMLQNRLLAPVLGAAILITPALAQRRGGGFGGPQPEPLTFRFMGPAVGNRISAAAGISGDPTTYYVGAASGGVWKSTNSGQSWSPIFDQQSAMAI